jgi:DNA-binding Lrp family transcriptional regulator
MALDRFDRMLLNLVQQDSFQTTERLSEQIPLSPSAIQRRLKRLRENGVIVRECAVIDPAKTQRSSLFLVTLQVEHERPEMLARLRSWLISEPHIQQAYYVTGEADFMLIVTARDASAYEDFMARLIDENPNVRHFTTNVTLKVVKQGLVTPLDTDTE